jgi:hypothetical protein
MFATFCRGITVSVGSNSIDKWHARQGCKVVAAR